MGVLNFTTYWGAIFTVQGHIKHAGTKLLRHFRLQLQAFAHPHFDTTVVITHRQKHACGLRSQQNVARMLHERVF